jgi:hypothetical protein
MIKARFSGEKRVLFHQFIIGGDLTGEIGAEPFFQRAAISGRNSIDFRVEARLERDDLGRRFHDRRGIAAPMFDLPAGDRAI